MGVHPITLSMVLKNKWKTRQLDHAGAFPQAPVESALHGDPKGYLTARMNMR
jgi:hypothetical protein